jgi:hypothetical protein
LAFARELLLDLRSGIHASSYARAIQTTKPTFGRLIGAASKKQRCRREYQYDGLIARRVIMGQRKRIIEQR